MFHFFAFINRMKYINRWGLMRNIANENIAEHSHQTAILAHALASIDKLKFNMDVNPEKAAIYAIFHDAPEIITGDMPTPVKYFNKEIQDSYKIIEENAKDNLLQKLPEYLKNTYSNILSAENTKEWQYVKAADTLSAYIKCLEELKAGNNEFLSAKITIEKKLQTYKMKSLDIFMQDFIKSYSLTLDEQEK